VRLSELAKVDAAVIAEQAKVVLSGEVGKAVTLKGIGATKGARAAIEAAGGTFQE
jgi:large subunit ribosomal protein L15